MKRIISISLIVFNAITGCQPDPGSVTADEKKDTAPAVETNTEIVELTEAQFSRADITVGELQQGSVDDIIKVNGMIDAPVENRYTISFPFGGYLKSNNLIPGMHVKKGSLLAVLEDASLIQLQQDYLLSRAKLSFLETDYQRQVELNKTQSNSQKTLQQSKTDLETERINSKALSEKLRLAGINPVSLTEKNISRSVSIYSPINGYISRVNANPGKYVAPTDILFELIDLSKLHIELTVFEKDAAELKQGQKISFSGIQHNGAKGTATIKLIAPAFNESRAVEVHCDIDAPAPKLQPGTFVTAEIKTTRHAGITVPDDAVVTWQNNRYIFVQESPRRFKMIPVKTGASTKGFTVLETDIPAATKIVTGNAY